MCHVSCVMNHVSCIMQSEMCHVSGEQHRDEGGVCQALSPGGGVPLQVSRVQQRQPPVYPQQRRQENSARGFQIRSRVSPESDVVRVLTINQQIKAVQCLASFLSVLPLVSCHVEYSNILNLAFLNDF